MKQLTYKRPAKPVPKAPYCLALNGAPSSNARKTSHGRFTAQGNYIIAKRTAATAISAKPAATGIPSLKIDVSTIAPQPRKNYLEFSGSRGKSPAETAKPKQPGKCLLGGALSKSMSELAGLGRLCIGVGTSKRSDDEVHKRVLSNLPSESSTPQIWAHPPLFPQSDKNVFF